MGWTAKDLLRILKRNGWTVVRVRGPHHILTKEGFPRPVIVPVHGNTDIGKFAEDILKQAGIDPAEERK